MPRFRRAWLACALWPWRSVAAGALTFALVAVAFLCWVNPASNRGHLADVKTRLDPDGICRQSQSYTCGPAAAVTALHELGLRADEREIALLAHTSSRTGTEPRRLAQGLQKRFGADGLVAEYRRFENLEELSRAGLTLAVLQFNASQDHCVTILGVQANAVVVGDPVGGLALVSKEEFENQWQFVGIVLKRVDRRSKAWPAQKLARRG